MIIPTKLISADKSLIYKAMQLLDNGSKDLSYRNNMHIFSTIVEYTDVITVLFILGYLDKETIEVKKNDSIRE